MIHRKNMEFEIFHAIIHFHSSIITTTTVYNTRVLHRASIDGEEEGSKADEDEGENDEVAKRLDVRQYNDQGELHHVHEHVERVLDAVHDATFSLLHGLLE